MNIKRKDICWLALFMFLLVPNLALAYGGYGEIFLMSLGLIVIGITTIIIYIAINTLIKMLFMKSAKSTKTITKVALGVSVSLLEILVSGVLVNLMALALHYVITSVIMNALLNLALLAIVGVTGAKRLVLYSLIMSIIPWVIFFILVSILWTTVGVTLFSFR